MRWVYVVLVWGLYFCLVLSGKLWMSLVGVVIVLVHLALGIV